MYRRRYSRVPVSQKRFSRRLRGRGAYTVDDSPVVARRKQRKARSSKKSSPRRSSNFIGKALGSLGGGILGGIVGGPPGVVAGSGIGGEVGSIAQDLFRNLTGFGAYDIKTNTLIGAGGQDPPMMHGAGSCIRIRHREFVRDIVSHGTANTFKVETFAIQPNISSTFPWLANIAGNFQEWVPLGVVFEFRSTSSDALNSTNTALGQVIMATQYNSNMPAPIKKQYMENTDFVVSCKPSLSAMHAVECDPSMMVLPRLYIQKPTTSTNDLRFQNLGNFSIATDGMQGTSVKVGELWVTYDILLCMPIQDSTTANLGDHWQLPTTVSTSDYFGYANQVVQLQSSSNLGCTLGAATITFPVGFSGNVAVTYQLVGASTAIVNPTLTGSNGASALTILRADTDSGLDVGNITSTVMAFTFYFTIVDPGNNTGAVITFSGGTLPGTLSSGDLIVQTIQNYN